MAVKIDLERTYSANEIVKLGLVPKWRNNFTAIRSCYEDKLLPKSKRLIDADIVGEGVKKRFYIKGKNLAKYVAAQKN